MITLIYGYLYYIHITCTSYNNNNIYLPTHVLYYLFCATYSSIFVNYEIRVLLLGVVPLTTRPPPFID